MSALHANMELLRKLLVGFVRDEVRKVGISKVVLGLSGGIDSALVVFIAAEALGPENVHAICMPYKTSNPESETHARLVATACGVNFSVVPITAMVDAYFDTFPWLQQLFWHFPYSDIPILSGMEGHISGHLCLVGLLCVTPPLKVVQASKQCRKKQKQLHFHTAATLNEGLPGRRQT